VSVDESGLVVISCAAGDALMDRWSPPIELLRREQTIMKRLKRVRALLGFLRLRRRELFDDAFQERLESWRAGELESWRAGELESWRAGELESMYRQTGAGEPPHPPTML
jgi:hypothetical protein